MRIFLVGFMGSGKSQMGAALAKELNVNFFDLDKEIEKKRGKMSLQFSLMKVKKKFREIEKKHLLNFLNKMTTFSPAVVALLAFQIT